MGSFLARLRAHGRSPAVARRRATCSAASSRSRRGSASCSRRARPQLVLAVGDTTTVVAAAFAARKTGSAFGHVEAGLRAFSRELPEEEHRICADALADLLFAPTRIAVANLDARARQRPRAPDRQHGARRAARASPAACRPSAAGILVTIHRQETVDDPQRARRRCSRRSSASARARGGVAAASAHASEGRRGRARDAAARSTITRTARSRRVPRSGSRARALVVTDSGGVQEEAAILGTPCVTVRDAHRAARDDRGRRRPARVDRLPTSDRRRAVARSSRTGRAFARPRAGALRRRPCRREDRAGVLRVARARIRERELVA